MSGIGPCKTTFSHFLHDQKMVDIHTVCKYKSQEIAQVFQDFCLAMKSI